MTTAQVLQEGDTLLANWGYDANNPHFFKVIKRTAKQVTIMQVKNQTVSLTNDGLGGKMVMPTEEPQTFSVWREANYDENGNPRTDPVILTKKVHTIYQGDEYVVLANFAYAYKWTGSAAHDFNWH